MGSNDDIPIINYNLRLYTENGSPNIVMIIADDMGYNDIGYHNPEVKTPHIGTFLHLLFYEC